MQSKTIATGAILLTVIIWGMTFAFIKAAVTTLNPFNFIFWRFAIASILLFVICFRKIELTNKKLMLQGIWLGLFLGITVICQTIGLRYTAASTASFITGLTVILVMLISCFLEKRWPTKFLVLAVILAMFGVGLITLTNGMSINRGDVWVMVCAVFFAIYIVLAGHYSRSDKPFTLTFYQLVTIAIMSLFLNLTNGKIIIPSQSNAWIGILFCAIFASVLAFNLQLKFQQYVSSNKTAIIFASEPIFATITAALYLHERITLIFVVGAGLIFLAILLSERNSKQKIIPQD